MVRGLKIVRFGGLPGFAVVASGQLLSLLGSGLSQFAFTLWAWRETGSATALALVAVSSTLPFLLFSPLAGALVDRWDRKRVLLFTDAASAVETLVLLLLYQSGQLELWHVCVAGAFGGLFQSLQWPAFAASISLMVSKTQYSRANGMLSLAESLAGAGAPLLAGLLLTLMDLGAILTIDLVSCAFALIGLALVHIPSPPPSAPEPGPPSSLFQDSLFGFRYIWRRPALLKIQLLLLLANLASGLWTVLLPPLLLIRSNNDSALLGLVLSASSGGLLAGGVLMSTWGGFRQRIHGVLVGILASRLLGPVGMALSATPLLWVISGFLGQFFSPVLSASNQAIWQAKTEPQVQGRVFAARRLIAALAVPLAQLTGGPLADRVFEPLMRQSNAWSAALTPLVGTGPGAGIALLMLIGGLIGASAGWIGYALADVRNVEATLPDHRSLLETDPNS